MASVIFTSRKKNIYIPPDDILYCEARGYFTLIHLSDQSTFRYARHLAAVESMLDARHFIRCHRSTIINIKHIKELLRENAYVLRLTDGSLHTVSARKRKEIVKALQKYHNSINE